MSPTITGKTVVAGVAGAPVQHSLSPIIHNAWLTAARVDGVYVPFSPVIDCFGDFVRGLRGGALRGLNITVPFKLEALELADRRTERAIAAGAANLLVFETSGEVFADNTDGDGLLAALVEQASGFAADAGPAVIIGAGGAARGAAAALLAAGAPEIRILNRSTGRAETLREQLGPRVRVLAGSRGAFDDANVVINATTLGLGGGEGPETSFETLPRTAIVMDMVYRPLATNFLQRARLRGLRTVDGLAMLIGQAKPSYQAFYGAAPSKHVDVRSLVVAILESAA